MSVNDVRVGHIGAVFTYTVLDSAGAAQDLTGVTLADQRLVFIKPSGKKLIVVPTWGSAGDGSDGQLRYITVAGDLDEAGPLFWGPVITGLSNWHGRADYVKTVIHGNI